ncbi:hypothetical protein P9B03_11935 [Metasolibacillus meyeri]|uniref:Uncharacterized protein n=1 Tax=Metasolibacillus meyeri TaxID=1071052 RepID=A0AAW9NRU7_9BACL|nr:hypothetical protein [Metasolibacillus meyeri]MEC1179196.1 hypothetical protein [Metasolibacillus meyeri]
MAKVALADVKIVQATATDHITYTKNEQTGTTPPTCPVEYMNPNGTCGYYTDSGYWIDMWIIGTPIYQDVDYKTDAKIDGTVTATVTNVKINGQTPIVKGDKTKETDSYTIPGGGTYKNGKHENITTGSVTGGNSKNVYVNGKLLAVADNEVTTHVSSVKTKIGTQGLSTNVNVGS